MFQPLTPLPLPGEPCLTCPTGTTIHDGMCADCNVAADEYITVVGDTFVPAPPAMTPQGILVVGSGPTRELRAYCNLCRWKGRRGWSNENSKDPMATARTEAREHAKAHG